MKATTLSSLLVMMFLIIATPALATTVFISASDAGFVTEMGGSAKGDGTISPATYNYSVGREEHFVDGALGSGLAFMERKNYLVFDLSSVTGPITAATVLMYAGPDTGPPFPAGSHGYESLDPNETFEIGETTDPGGALALISDLLVANGVGPTEFDDPNDPAVLKAKDLFAKLSDGPLVLGTVVVSPADDDTTLSIPISGPGLDYVGLFAGGPIVLSGTLPSAVMPDPDSQEIFGFTGPDIPGGGPLVPVLKVTFIPEPGTIALAMMSLALFISRRSSMR